MEGAKEDHSRLESGEGGRALPGLWVYTWDNGFCSFESSLLGECEHPFSRLALVCLFTQRPVGPFGPGTGVWAVCPAGVRSRWASAWAQGERAGTNRQGRRSPSAGAARLPPGSVQGENKPRQAGKERTLTE